MLIFLNHSTCNQTQFKSFLNPIDFVIPKDIKYYFYTQILIFLFLFTYKNFQNRLKFSQGQIIKKRNFNVDLLKANLQKLKFLDQMIRKTFNQCKETYMTLQKLSLSRQNENIKIQKPHDKLKVAALFRKEFFKQLKSYFKEFLKRQISKQNTHKYNQSLNPIYSQISKFPFHLNVCGFCKAIYSSSQKYLYHCFAQKCPINHERSTHFFCSKNKIPLKNKDLQNYQFDYEEIKNNPLRVNKSSSLLLNFRIQKTLNASQNTKMIKCGKCKQLFDKRYTDYYLKHCLYKCLNPLDPRNEYLFHRKQVKQPLLEFVQDILNLTLNYNLFNLFQNQYIQLVVNQNNKGRNRLGTYFCRNCSFQTDKQNQLIAHVIFECQKEPHPQSSHKLIRKQVEREKIKQNTELQKSQKIIVKKKINKAQKIKINQKPNKNKRTTEHEINNNEQNQQLEEQQLNLKQTKSNLCHYNDQLKYEDNQPQKQIIQQKINPKYSDYEYMLGNIYFCGSCLHYFDDKIDYLCHFIVFQCSFKHSRNTYLYIYKNSNKAVKIEQIRKKILDNQFLKFYENGSKLNELKKKAIYLDNKTNQIKVQGQKIQQFRCGKCSFRVSQQFTYFDHVIKQCHSYYNSNNSHKILLKKQRLYKQRFTQFFDNLIFSINISRINPNTVHTLIKNTKNEANLNQELYCGTCESFYKNKFQFVYHCISVCQSEKCQHSSYNIRKHKINSDEFELQKVVQLQNQSLKAEKILQICSQQQQYKLAKQKFQRNRVIEKVKYSFNQKIICIQQKYQNQDEFKPQQKIPISRQNIVYDKIGAQTQIKQRKLIHNIFYQPQISSKIIKPQSNDKYYCACCKIFYKYKIQFINHLILCRSFQNFSSSHYFITLDHYSQIVQNQSIIIQKYQKEYQIFPQYLQNNSTPTCGKCGSTYNHNFYRHVYLSHKDIVPQGSSHIILKIKFTNQINPAVFYMPITIASETKLKQKFICPCNTSKQLSRKDFTYHVMKRHKGLAPKFCMAKRQTQI